MNQTLPNFVTSKKPRFFLLILCVLLSFQRGNTQHCFPGFQYSVDGNAVTFNDQSTADGTITAYNWNFCDGQTSAEQNPTHTYAASGTYNACLTITAHNPSCTDTYCHHVVVVHPPSGVCQAAFIAHQPNPAHQTVDFTDQSTSDGTIGSWVWDFGDGSTSTDQNPSHTYAQPGTYLVCLIITDNDGVCTSHVCLHVVVHHPPAGVCQAVFNAHQPDPAHLTIDFTDQSTSDGTIGSWAWDFGDGHTSTEQNPSHTYAQPGTYLVCLIIANNDGNCTSHACHHIVVPHPVTNECHAAFTVHVDASGFSVQFTNTSAGTTDHTTYSWDFGDGDTTSTEGSPHHIYAHSGHYTVCLFIADTTTGCSSHICQNINVHHGGVHHYHPQLEHIEGVAASKTEPRGDRIMSPSAQIVVYPNPAIDAIQVVYQIPVTAKVKFELYSLIGAKVVELAENAKPAGTYTEFIRVGNLPTGEYVLKVIVDGIPHVRQITVL
jgi:PKD repeat protein